MSEFGTNERLLRSDVTMEECRKIEKVLRKNNISYLKFLQNTYTQIIYV